MPQSNLLELTYFDPKAQVRLTTYADTIITEPNGREESIAAVRFGGYPEMVRAMSDAIYGGGTVDLIQNGNTFHLKSKPQSYQRHMSHDGTYATATLIISDEALSANQQDDGEDEKENTSKQPEPPKPRKCYIFCPARDRDSLFAEVDRKTAAPLLPEFQDYVLDELTARKILRRMKVFALHEKLDAWLLELLPDDRNVADVLEQGLKEGKIMIPGAVADKPDGFRDVTGVTSYLNTFGVDVAERIRNQFIPLFDPAAEPLSEEILTINDYIQQQAGYSLYDAQLAVAETVKRQLDRRNAAFIVAECGTGKTKIGSTALGALHGLMAAQRRRGATKTFNLVMCPSHVTRKWVREIGETLPDTYGMVVKSIADFDRLYAMYEAGDKNVFAVFSKERARNGYMRYPAVHVGRRHGHWYLACPDCGKPVMRECSDDGSRYFEHADPFFFQREHRQNRVCRECGSMLWAPVVPGRNIPWTKINDFGWICKEWASVYLIRTKNTAVQNKLQQIADHPQDAFPVAGAIRRFPLSTYIKKKYRGRIDGFLCDELHEYNNKSGQGDAMAELFSVSKQFVGMTATLINGYSSGIFHLLYRVVLGLMNKDGKSYRRPGDFDAEYGVVEETYETIDAEYNSNRRVSRRKTQSRQLPGVSPLVFSRFLLEYTAFLSLSDMGKDLPDYEEIPVPLEMPEEVYAGYKHAEDTLRRFMKSDRKAARKLLSAYMNLLTVYPDQPYGQPEIVHPINGSVVVMPKSIGDFNSILPKEEKTLEIVWAKVAAGECVLIYTSWTRTDSQRKLQGLLNQEGIHTDILAPTISPEKREAWVEQRVNSGLQVLITNPKCVETGLDLNAFTTLIFYSMGYNLFTLRQASHRSWRINQTAPRVEVYMLYYADTMQAKAMKLMASKLAVAGLVEGSFSEEGLAAMSDVRDMTSQMAKELAQGIKDNVEDIAAAFKKMAVINPDRERRQQVTLPATERKPVMICRVTISWRRKEIMQMLRDEMLAVIADVNTQVAERDELVECIAIALLTRKNLFILGAPGQAKSCAINAFRSRITGARQFERLLSKQTDEEQLFGRIDLVSLLPGSVAQAVLDNDPQYCQMHSSLKNRLASGQDAGDLPEQMERRRKALAELHGSEPQVNTAGKIPESEICFLDEIFKCNDGVLNSLLTALNERKYTNEGRTYPIPTLSFFAASNEIPNFSDPQEKILEALYDRLDLKLVTENISDRGKRMAVLRDKQAGWNGQIVSSITLEQLLDMQREVQSVSIPDAANELADDILCELRKPMRISSQPEMMPVEPTPPAKLSSSCGANWCGSLVCGRSLLIRRSPTVKKL